jgi:aryl carrier-like protein
MARILFVSDHLANEGLGIMSLSSHLKAHGHDVDLTLLTDHPSLEAVVEHVAAARPDVVGFSMMTPQVPAFRPVARALKR